jgi:amino acid adenylation domain-containing protein
MKQLDPVNILDMLALTPLQEGMLYHFLKDPGSDIYYEQLSLDLSGPLNPVRFEEAWNLVVEHNEMLRVLFRWEKMNAPVQVILKRHPLQPVYHDLTLSGAGPGSRRERLNHIKKKDREERFDLRRVPFRVALCKLGEDNHVMVISYHHILFDGWSTGIILKEFFRAYGEERFKPPTKARFKDFVRWIRNPDKTKQEKYWIEYLKGIDSGTELSVKRQETGGDKGKDKGNGLTRLPLGSDLPRRVREFSSARKLTEAALYYSAWGVLLRHYNNSDDVVFGTTVSGRAAALKGIENSVGLFINTLPLRLTGKGSSALRTVSQINGDLHDREVFSGSSLTDIKTYSGLAGGDELFDSVVIVENYPLDHRSFRNNGGLSISSYDMVEMTHYDLNVAIMTGEALEVTFGYNTSRFESRGIDRLAGHFQVVLRQLVTQPERAVDEFELFTPDEKEQVLTTFNNTNGDVPADKTIIQLFESQVESAPDRIALIGRENGSYRTNRTYRTYITYITYRQLNRRSNESAQRLREEGVQPGGIVAIKMERSIDMVIAIYGILKAGAAYLPLEPGYPQERIDYILADSGAILFTPSPSSAGPPLPGGDQPAAAASPGDAAYVIYTSGTTGKPKGVVVEHRSVVNQLWGLQCMYPLTRRDIYLLKTAYVFDVSVTELYGWFWDGGSLAVLDAGDEKDPRKILEAINLYAVTHINFVPSLFNAFVDSLDQDNTGLLSSLKYIFLAGEALPAELVNKFVHLKTGIPLENLYGPTETTIYGSGYSLGQWDGSGNIPIGKPVRNGTLYILDRNLRPQPAGLWGELHIGGANLARGYLNRPELTADRFISIDSLHHPPSTSHRLYKTGDMARWLPDGNVEFLGRMDHQVKIRGFRIEPGEIENRLLTHPAIKESVVVARENEAGEKYLCAYMASAHSFSTAEFRDFLSTRVPEYMIPAFYVILDRLPLTASGKVDRRSLPEPKLQSDSAYAAPNDDLERKLVEIWSGVLGVKQELIGIDRNFFELGGHSLKVTGLMGRIHKQLDVDIPFGQLFKSPTVRGLAGYVRQSSEDRFQAMETAEEREYYPLSSVQKRLYLLHLMDPDSLAYNMATVVNLQGELDVAKLLAVFRELINRHETFRTSIHTIGEEPVQRIHHQVDFDWETIPLGYRAASPEYCPPLDIVKQFIRPFNLETPPLFRLGFISCNDNCHGLIVDMHHIIADGVSLDLFVSQVVQYYNDGILAPLKYQYRDFVQWQRRYMTENNPFFIYKRNYWLEQFEGDIPVLDLPLDYERPELQSFDGGRLDFVIDEQETRRLKQLARGEDASLFMVLLGMFNILLSRLTGQEDIVVGTGVEGRSHADLREIIGMFVNTLALRNYPAAGKSFRQFLKQIKTNTIDAMENQDYPFEELVDHLSLPRDTGRNPVFDVLFQFSAREIPEIKIPGLTLNSFTYHRNVSKFDLTLWAFEKSEEYKDRLVLRFEYSTRLFKLETMELFKRYFEQIVSAVLENPAQSLGHIRQLPQEEKALILERMNTDLEEETRRLRNKYAGKAFQHLLLDSLQKHKNRVALEYGQRSITFGELDERSDGIAYRLREEGVEPFIPVGVLTHDRMSLITAMIAVLKSRAVFVPLDTGLPPGRLELMIRSVGMRVIIGDSREEKYEHVRWLPVDGPRPESPTGKELSYQPGDPIYIYYTSGSTGTPKAILGRAGGLLHFIDWETETFAIDKTFRFSQLSAPGFDAFLRDVCVPLCTGGTVCIPGAKETLLHGGQLLDWLEQSHVYLISCVPAVFRLFTSNPLTASRLPALRVILFSGERITASHLEPWFRIFGDRVTLVNLWGTSETTLAKTFHVIGPEDLKRPRIPVGKPLRGAAVVVLNEQLRWCEPLVTGELYIRTPFRSLGYYNDDEANDRRFIANPFDTGPEDLLHKTGDLGHLLADGAIDLLGRNDRQVKIRGIRIEPGEIESLLRDHPSVKEAAVIKKTLSENNEILCTFIVGDKQGLHQYLVEKLPDYMVPAQITVLESMPRSPNGKTDYRALERIKLETPEEHYDEPGTQAEKTLARLWRDILKKDRISTSANFFSLGGNSLNVMSLISRIHGEFDVRVPLGVIFKNPTLKQQAAIIEAEKKDIHTAVQPVEEKEYYPLSAAQKRLYILNQLDEDNISYNIPAIIELQGKAEKDKLQSVFKKLIYRHESLRTSFHMIGGQPVQRVHGNVEFFIGPIGQIGPIRPIGPISPRIGPFDLSTPPLMRAELVQAGEDRYFLIVDMHHIITDGESIATFIREFIELYAGKELRPLHTRYRDFALWQEKQRETGALNTHQAYWTRMFPGEIPLLNLPYDAPRPPVLEFEGNTIYSQVGREETRRLNRFAGSRDVTLFMVLLAAYNVLLSKLSGQEDILVGIPAAGRSHADIQPVFGMFVNTLVMRNLPAGNRRFNDFLRELKDRTLEAFEHQDYQFEDLVESLDAGKDPGRNPLFDTMFVLENMATPTMEIPGLKLKQHDYRTNVAKFDMILNCSEIDGNIKFFVEYRVSLFKEETIKRFIRYFKKLLSDMPALPHQTLSQYEIITPEEKQRILYKFNDSSFPAPQGKTVYQAFEEQAGVTPDRVALTGFGRGQMTYGRLNRETNRLARFLRTRGITCNSRVGVMMERSPEVVLTILAILKAGGTYLPIDPDYPQRRIADMIEESGTSLALTTRAVMHRQDRPASNDVLAIDDPGIAGQVDAQDEKNLEPVSHSNDLIYIIFTSGSTGKPKGAGVYHGSFYNLVYWNIHQFRMNEQDNILLLTSLSFDLTQKNLYSALMVGGILSIPSINYFDPAVIMEEIVRLRVTVVNCTPSMMYRMVEYGETAGLEKLSSIRYAFLGGEPIAASMMENWIRSEHFNARIINTYGPTECTDICAFYSLNQPLDFLNRGVPTGGPVYNAKLYVVDRYRNLQPVGVPGELLIGGVGVGIGYVNDDRLTAEKFIRHSFEPGQPDMRLYHSGDLVKWLPGGIIEFLGRIDHQVKVRGFRIELGEIENQILAHSGVKETVVLARKQEDGDHYLCAYVVPQPGQSPDAAALKQHLAAELPGYMAPSYFTILEKMPLNPNGKVDRKALPPPESVDTEEDAAYAAPTNETETQLRQIWQSLLKVNNVGIDDNFFDIGGHSLKVLQLVNALHKQFNVKVNFQDIFQYPSIRELSRLVRAGETSGKADIEIQPEKEYYELSYTQQRMWLLNRFDPGDPAFNLKARLTLDEAVKEDAVNRALAHLAARHEAFRTCFKTVKGQPVQVILDTVPVEPEVIDISALPVEERETRRHGLFQDESTVPFELDRPPLFRMKLIKCAENRYDVILTMHHIVTDGWSLEVLEQEFPKLYNACKEGGDPGLEPLPVRYRDYVYWHNQQLADKDSMEGARRFWESQLGGETPVMDLPYDFSKIEMKRKESVAYRVVVPETVYYRLKQVAKQCNASLFMVLLASYNMLLSRVSGQDTIMLGVPGAARQHEDLKNVIGLFVNTLILKNSVDPSRLFTDLLQTVQDSMMQVLEYQDYPLELICSEFKIRYPELSVFFNMSIFGNTLNEELTDLAAYHVLDVQNAKFDIVCYLEEYKNGIEINTVYYRELFKPETIEQIMRLYLGILENISTDPGKAVKEYYKTAKRKRLKLN